MKSRSTPEQPRSPTGGLLGGRIRLLAPTESEIVVADPFTGEVKQRVRAPYPNFSAALTTAGGLVFTGLGDGTFIAYDDESMQELWKINVGSGFNAPPMTFESRRQAIRCDHVGAQPDLERPADADSGAQ